MRADTEPTTGYEDEFAEIYDAVYRGRGKDYAGEAKDVADLVRDRVPDASSLLDVACGTGAHLRHFATLFDDARGLELSASMLDIARSRMPGVPLHQGDMRSFDLGPRVSAVTCMFSSVGHLATTAELDATLRCFARHTRPGGVAVIEPWWFPETFTDGYVAGDIVRVDGRTISRVSHSVRDGGATRMEIHYVIADAEHGPRHLVEHHRITLFPRHAYTAAYEKAGYTVEYLDGGPSGRGLFVGTRT
uniref:Methyltransferase n=1 Tax=Streptomyces antibioticus TaxID=1890 RepID=O87832_STRAT|nr:methyltransferase [Streptomyces antibioticus]